MTDGLSEGAVVCRSIHSFALKWPDQKTPTSRARGPRIIPLGVRSAEMGISRVAGTASEADF